MSDPSGLKAKLGLDVFKPAGKPHIAIKPGKERDSRLRPAVRLCPAGCYQQSKQGEIELNVEGCLECGTCRLACGTDILEWRYPDGGCGVQFRYG